MRTTVRIDDELMRELKALAHREQISLARLFNKILRRGLAAENGQRGRTRRPFRQETADLGELRVPLGLNLSPHKALAIAAALEDEAIIERLARGK
jgi:hypothetical protein